MAEDRELRLAELEIDLENYRIGTQTTVRDAIAAMVAEQGSKLGRLGADILERGLNPLKRLMVTPLEDDPTRFRVLEGNRRVTAMKLINMPALGEGTRLYTTFRKLNKQKAKLPTAIKCVILTPEEGFIWREREHSTGQNGLGTEQWGANARLRAAADQGKKAHAHDVLELVLSGSELSAAARAKIEVRKFKVSNLNRLLDSTDVRVELGLDTTGPKVQSIFSQDWVSGILCKVVEIIATEKMPSGKAFTVKDIYTSKDQLKFIHNLAKGVAAPKEPVPTWTFGATGAPEKPVSKTAGKRKKPNPATRDRSTLVPDNSEVIPATGRANDIYLELRSLDLGLHTNAASILFRVFIEFSIDQFVKKNSVNVSINKELKVKIAAVSQYMQSSGLMHKKELVTIDSMVGTLGELVSTVTLNAYVHNERAFPSTQELRISWDRIEHFLVKLWAQ